MSANRQRQIVRLRCMPPSQRRCHHDLRRRRALDEGSRRGKKALQTLAIGRCPKDAADDRGAKESIPKSLVWPQRIGKLHDCRATELKMMSCRGFVALYLVKIRGGRVYAPFSEGDLEVIHSLQCRREAFVCPFQISIVNRDSCVCLPGQCLPGALSGCQRAMEKLLSLRSRSVGISLSEPEFRKA